MKAKKKPLETKSLADLGLSREDQLEVVSLTPPPARTGGKVIGAKHRRKPQPPWSRPCMRKQK
jgi:electron transfer flavoprotein alpha/beta subunit